MGKLSAFIASSASSPIQNGSDSLTCQVVIPSPAPSFLAGAYAVTMRLVQRKGLRTWSIAPLKASFPLSTETRIAVVETLLPDDESQRRKGIWRKGSLPAALVSASCRQSRARKESGWIVISVNIVPPESRCEQNAEKRLQMTTVVVKKRLF